MRTPAQVDFFPEQLFGFIGYIDDVLVALTFLFIISERYRYILLAEQGLAPPAAPLAAAPAAPPGARNTPIGTNMMWGALAAAATVAAIGAVVTAVGAGVGAAGLAALMCGASIVTLL